jgi:hypothetical protein
LRIEIENLKREIQNNSGSNEISTDQQATGLKSKDEEIDKLKTDILKDQQIIDDIQATQRTEMMEKEKEIYALNKALQEESEEWIRKGKELNKFEGNSSQVTFLFLYMLIVSDFCRMNPCMNELKRECL